MLTAGVVSACRLHQARLGAGIRVRREVDLTPILSPAVARAQKSVAILITTTSPTQNIVFGVSNALLLPCRIGLAQWLPYRGLLVFVRAGPPVCERGRATEARDRGHPFRQAMSGRAHGMNVAKQTAFSFKLPQSFTHN